MNWFSNKCCQIVSIATADVAVATFIAFAVGNFAFVAAATPALG